MSWLGLEGTASMTQCSPTSSKLHPKVSSQGGLNGDSVSPNVCSQVMFLKQLFFCIFPLERMRGNRCILTKNNKISLMYLTSGRTKTKGFITLLRSMWPSEWPKAPVASGVLWPSKEPPNVVIVCESYKLASWGGGKDSYFCRRVKNA